MASTTMLVMSGVNVFALLFSLILVYYGLQLRDLGGVMGRGAYFTVGGGLALSLVFLVSLLRMNFGIMVFGPEATWDAVHHILMAISIGLLAGGAQQISQILQD